MISSLLGAFLVILGLSLIAAGAGKHPVIEF